MKKKQDIKSYLFSSSFLLFPALAEYDLTSNNSTFPPAFSINSLAVLEILCVFTVNFLLTSVFPIIFNRLVKSFSFTYASTFAFKYSFTALLPLVFLKASSEYFVINLGFLTIPFSTNVCKLTTSTSLNL